MNSNGLSMDELTLKEILTEQIEENKATRKYITQLEQIIADRDQVVKDLIVGFEEKSSNFKVVVPKPDLSEVNATIDAKLTGIQQAVEKKPIPVIRQLRFLLFPETNVMQYYKTVFGRFAFWLTSLLIATYLFMLGQQFIEAWQARRYNEQAEQCVRAWIYMDEHGSKQVKKAMVKAWSVSNEKKE